MGLHIEVGHTFERRGTVYKVVYVDDERLLLENANDGTALLEARNQFEDSVEAGLYDAQQAMTTAERVQSQRQSSRDVPYGDIDWIGDMAAESLCDAGYETVPDVQSASDEELLACDYVGAKGLSNLRDWLEVHA